MTNRAIILQEWGTTQLTPVEANAVANYLDSTKKHAIGNLGQRNLQVRRDGTLRNGGNNVGILSIKGSTLELRPKLDGSTKEERPFWRFLPHMLSAVTDLTHYDNHIFIDPDCRVTLPKGTNIVPLLALSFVSLLEKALEIGAYKQYIRRQDAPQMIRGKILTSRLASTRPWNKAKLPCEYSELTFDNPVNQIVLWSAHRLHAHSLFLLDSVTRNSVSVVTLSMISLSTFLLSIMEFSFG